MCRWHRIRGSDQYGGATSATLRTSERGRVCVVSRFAARTALRFRRVTMTKSVNAVPILVSRTHSRGKLFWRGHKEVNNLMLLIAAVLGIIFGRWLGVSRPVFMAPAFVNASAVRSGHAAGRTDRSWRILRLPSGRLRTAGAAALLVWGVASVALVVQSQTATPTSRAIAPTDSAVGAEFYLKRGEDFSGVHQYDRAIADFATAIQLKPDYAEAYNNRGFAYYLKGDAERAISDYTRAIELRPNYPKAYNSRGVAYMAHGYGAAKSVPDFDRAIALKPDFRYAYINRANARLASHPWLALQDFHRAGMYPERTIAILGGAVLILIAGIVWIRRRVLRRASGAA